MKTLKALVLVSIGLSIWIAIVYSGIAFLKVELKYRGVMLFLSFCYVAFFPMLVMAVKDELDK